MCRLLKFYQKELIKLDTGLSFLVSELTFPWNMATVITRANVDGMEGTLPSMIPVKRVRVGA